MSPPTIWTLTRCELLEQMLVEYTGTLLLVSHDRTFLDNVVTQTIALGRQRAMGRVRRRIFAIGCGSARRRARPNAAPRAAAAPAPSIATTPKRKLSFKEQRELESLPGDIEKLEGEQLALTQQGLRTGLPSRRRRADAPSTASAPTELVALDRRTHGAMGGARITGLTSMTSGKA